MSSLYSMRINADDRKIENDDRCCDSVMKLSLMPSLSVVGDLRNNSVKTVTNDNCVHSSYHYLENCVN